MTKTSRLRSRLLSAALALAMLFTMAPTGAFAADGNAAPTVDINGRTIYANGTPLVIEADGEGTTVYIDTNLNGEKDDGEQSLKEAGVADAPENGADLSGWTAYGASNNTAFIGDTHVTMNSGILGYIYGGSYVGTLTGDTHVTMNGGELFNIYGGGNIPTITGDTNVTINGGKINRAVNTNSYGRGSVSGAATLTINGGVIGIAYLSDPNRVPVKDAVLIIKGGAINEVLALDVANITGEKSFVIEGGSIVKQYTTSSVTNVLPTDGNKAPVYKTSIELSGATEGTEVTRIMGPTSYGTNGLQTNGTGKIYLWLPENTVTKAVRTADKYYAGTVSTSSDNAAKATFQEAEDTTLLEAKQAAQAAVDNYTVTNDTEAADVLKVATDAIVPFDGVSAAWDGDPTITRATTEAAGSITGTILLTYDNKTETVSVDRTIAKLADDNTLEQARQAAQKAVNSYAVTNDTEGTDVLQVAMNAIAAYPSVTAAWSSSPVVTKATTSAAGAISGTIILTYEGKAATVTVSLTIPKLSSGGGSNGGGGGSSGGKSSGSGTTAPASAADDFIDIQNHWAKSAIEYVVDKNLFKGITDTIFAPDAPMTRAMLWTVLARNASVDTTGGASWYEQAQLWVVSTKISDGTKPNGSITREELATILYRLAGSPDVSAMAASEFKDSSQVSAYAVDAIRWATSTGILKGTDTGRLAPKAGATRAEVATMLMRYLSK